MPTYVYLIAFIVLVLAIVLRSLPWREWAVKWVGNNPVRAQIYIEDGAGNTYTVQGKRTNMAPQSQTYRYEDGDGVKFVLVPGAGTKNKPLTEYPYKYIRGRRIIGVQDGQLVASPLGFMTAEEKTKYAESVTEISELLESGVLTATVRSVRRTGGVKVNWFLIIILVGAVGYFLYTNVLNKPAGNNNPAPPDNVNPGTPGLEQEPPQTLYYQGAEYGLVVDHA